MDDFDTLGGYVVTGITAKNVLLYVDGETLEIEENKKNEIPSGNVMLTAEGNCLKNITSTQMPDGYSELVKKYMNKRQVKLKEHPGYRVIKEENRVHCEKIG